MRRSSRLAAAADADAAADGAAGEDAGVSGTFSVQEALLDYQGEQSRTQIVSVMCEGLLRTPILCVCVCVDADAATSPH